MKYHIVLSGMGCERCIRRVTDAMNSLGAEIISILLNDVTVVFNGDVAVLCEALEDLGFDIVSSEKI